MSAAVAGKNEPRVGVFTVVNDDFVPGFICMERSLRKTNPGWDLPINILYERHSLPLSAESRNLIESLCRDVHFREVQVEHYAHIMEYAGAVLDTPRRLLAAFYVLDAFQPREFDRVLCLDSDMLICGDISPLLEVEAGFAAAEAITDDGKLGRGFVNTGVMIANRPWIERLRPEVILNYCAGKVPRRGSGKADQALINMAIPFNKISLLGKRYNFTKRLLRLGVASNGDTSEINAYLANNDVRVLHYVGEKPWLQWKDDFEPEFVGINAFWLEHLAEVGSPELTDRVEQLRAAKALQREQEKNEERSRASTRANRFFYWPRAGRLRRGIADALSGGYFSKTEQLQIKLKQDELDEKRLLEELDASIQPRRR